MNEVEAADKYIERFYTKTLGPDVLKAIKLKWFRLNTIYYIKNKEGKKVRFRPNQQQRDFYINKNKNDIILKARQLGFTTFKMIYDLDDCLFIDDYAVGCIAHNDSAAKEIFRNKVKYAYESIPQGYLDLFDKISSGIPIPQNDTKGQYVFSNGSSISVSTGYRGGTLQSLHVSEFGKICKKRPDVAQEIINGAFESVPKNGTKTIESTAEGREGYFFQYCDEALTAKKQGKKISSQDFNIHFYPWYEDPEYAIDEETETPKRLESYFAELELKCDIKLTNAQKSWYVSKEKVQRDKMKQEYPSTPDEAFEASVDGAYYARQFEDIYKDKRICEIPESDDLVCTAWDLGVRDSTSIWFYRRSGKQIHIIDYYENSGEGLEHYLKVLKDKGYYYETHYAPHDIGKRELGAKGAKAIVDTARDGYLIDDELYSINFEVLKSESINCGIELARSILDRCVFSVNIRNTKTKTKESEYDGISCLENYRKEWNQRLGSYKDNPLHDWASHGADAFRYLAYAENKRTQFIGTSNWNTQ